jgi:hypothetical protein
VIDLHAEGFAGADEVFLAGEFGEVAGAHALGERHASARRAEDSGVGGRSNRLDSFLSAHGCLCFFDAGEVSARWREAS